MRIDGVIERRLLVNYRVAPEVLQPWLPAPFRPQLRDGAGVAGICLIRMGDLRPAGLPSWAGTRSENAAHRIAVEWDGPAGPLTGVYIRRRDTDARLNVLAGGRVFPGRHRLARFDVSEDERRVQVACRSLDGTVTVDVAVRVAAALEGSALFDDIADASAFFEAGNVGYSGTMAGGRVEGVELRTRAWRVEPVTVEHASSSWLDDPARFPPGSAVLDSAMLMRQVPVTWHPAGMARRGRLPASG